MDTPLGGRTLRLGGHTVWADTPLGRPHRYGEYEGCNRVGLNTVVSRVSRENPVLVSCRVANRESDTARIVARKIKAVSWRL